MKRRLFNILSAVSLLLCIFVVVVWMYGFFWVERFAERNGRSSITIEPNWICCTAEADKGTLPVPDPRPWAWTWTNHTRMPPERSTWRFDPPFAPDTMDVLEANGRVVTRHMFYLPYWLPALVAGLMPGIWLWGRWTIRFRRKHGLCLNCGYDLRASKERCPECGTPVAATVKSSRITDN